MCYNLQRHGTTDSFKFSGQLKYLTARCLKPKTFVSPASGLEVLIYLRTAAELHNLIYFSVGLQRIYENNYMV